MQKNDYINNVECIDYTHDCQGIVKVDGFPVFVKNMIVGEIGDIKIIKVLKSYAVGRLLTLHQTSDYRVSPRCPLFKQCGGCHVQHLSNEGQQLFKTNRVKSTLKRIGHIDIEVQSCMMMDEPWFYRNKVQVPVGMIDHKIVTGFYKQHTNDIIPYDTCFVQNDESNQLVKRVKELLNQFHEKPYDKLTHSGNIRHILIKYGYQTQSLMLIFITYIHKIKKIDKIISILTKEFDHLETIVQNINSRHDNVILGDEVQILYGKGYIEDHLLGNTYRISTHSFYQVNPIQVEKLYTTAISLAHLKKTDTVIDAYCGIGTISLSLARYVHHVYGVEVVSQAISDAKENAIRNNIDNVTFVCQDAGDFMVDFTKQNKTIDVVFVDPPRKGCSTKFLEQLIELSSSKIIYISCNVATQARDIAYLSENYKAHYCQPVDMFPQCHHIENVLLLERILLKY
ncbi:MAG: 23S rRNA (uracil(1939)-C(5))-methyltransferase RlmD [Erysipelotrichaceae bacterium]|nr:23S rRNA (uracil(1939)-C(5))-methyltransferase RlmD [Erysipelotrichaceae bacterium]